LDARAVEEFFLGRYRPTPLVAPWGARSGFYPGSSEAAARTALERILESDLERLGPFREVIVLVRALLERLGMSEKPKDDGAKLDLLRACRAELPDDVLPWLDACYVLTDESRAFPPLLGTGGNEGSGSYVSGFAQLVIACVIERNHDQALAAAVFGVARPNSGSGQTPGQFAPFAAGGPNAATGFEGRTVMNPWDYLLCLEGTLLFAAAATKRLEASSKGALAYPFTVRTVGAGTGSVAMGDEATARAETWFPLWARPATLAEISAVLAEGRVQVGGRTARDALDFARAVSSLGIQRGITCFQRYSYLQRFGRNVIAVPTDRVEVRRNPRGDLIDELERSDWLASFRRLARQREPAPPARLRSLVARLEDALFDLTRTDHPSRVQSVLIRLGEAQEYLARSPTARKTVSPVPALSGRWVQAADDGSPEYRIAAALAGLHARVRPEEGSPRLALPMAVHFGPVDPQWWGVRDRRRWLEGAERHVTWGPGGLSENLRALAVKRLQAAARMNLADGPWLGQARAPLGAIGAWFEGAVDEARIADLLPGLVLSRVPNHLPHVVLATLPPPPAYAVLKPAFTSLEQLHRVAPLPSGKGGHDGETRASPSADAAAILRLLAAERVDEAVALGVRRLRANGRRVRHTLEHAAHPEGKTLLGALLVPLSDADLRRLLERVAHSEEERLEAISIIETEA
jgi:CRISPR-associated protein Csx17